MKTKILIILALFTSSLSAQAVVSKRLLVMQAYDVFGINSGSITLYENGEFWYYSTISDVDDFTTVEDHRLVAKLPVDDAYSHIQPMIDAIKPNAKLVNSEATEVCLSPAGISYNIIDQKYENGVKTIQVDGCKSFQFKAGSRNRKAADALVELLKKVADIVMPE